MRDQSIREFYCGGCGKLRKQNNVGPWVWPWACSCGYRNDEDGGGWGDKVAGGLKRLGLRKPCGGCTKRKQALNRLGQMLGG